MRQTVKVCLPLLGILVVIVAVQVWWSRGYSPTGHAAEHFAGASIVFRMAFVLWVIVWALPAPIRRRPGLWVLLGLIAATAIVNASGNLEVVDAIGDEDWSLETVDVLGPTRDGFEEGHQRGEQGGLAGVVVAGALAVWLWARGVISRRLAFGAVVMSVLFPYWIFPGAGLLLLAGMLGTRRLRLERAAMRAVAAPALV